MWFVCVKETPGDREKGETLRNQVLRLELARKQNCVGARFRVSMYSFKFCVLLFLANKI